MSVGPHLGGNKVGVGGLFRLGVVPTEEQSVSRMSAPILVYSGCQFIPVWGILLFFLRCEVFEPPSL